MQLVSGIATSKIVPRDKRDCKQILDKIRYTSNPDELAIHLSKCWNISINDVKQGMDRIRSTYHHFPK